MADTSQKSPADYITPLYINGLQGRMLHMPAPKDKQREILFVYGHHASLERYWGIMEDLNDYGAVTMPDLPGFGGMDSFYKVGKQPTLDNFADYMATFVKLRFRRKRLTVVGFSLGFVIVTRMLQRYPDLAEKVDLLVSAVGFTHHEDFSFTPVRKRFYLTAARLFSHRMPAVAFKNIALHPTVLRVAYSKTYNAKEKFADLDREKHKAIMNFEIHLWHCNDVRTRMVTVIEMLTVDNCHQQVKLPVWHIAVDADRYFDNHRVEQHMRVIFEDFHAVKSKMENHGPSVILTKAEARPFMPAKIRQLLAER
jgi:pimeloyl-ACP methyl ester carboxylesterase